LFSPSSEVSPTPFDLPPEPCTPSPLNVDVTSGPPSKPTEEEFYDVIERSSLPSVSEGRCPSYDESHGHPSSLLAIVMERRSQQPKQALQLFSPSSNIAPDDDEDDVDEETWLTEALPQPPPVGAQKVSVHPDQPTAQLSKSAMKHPLDSELEAFLDPSVPRIESASESENEARRPSPLKKTVTFDDDTLFHIIEERDNAYYGLQRKDEDEDEELLLLAGYKNGHDTWKSELEAFVADDAAPADAADDANGDSLAHDDDEEEELLQLVNDSPPMLHHLHPAPVQERNHMASQELEAFLASVSEPSVTEPEDQGYGDQSTDAAEESAELLTPRAPKRSMSITSTSSLILDDVHSIRLPGETAAEDELARIHRSVGHFDPSYDDPIVAKSRKSVSPKAPEQKNAPVNPLKSPQQGEQSRSSRKREHSADSEEEVSSRHPSEEVFDEASTADDSARSFHFEDSSRKSSSTSTSASKTATSSASTIISSTPRPDDVTPSDAVIDEQGSASEHEQVTHHGVVTVTYEVEEERRYLPKTAAATATFVEQEPIQLLYGHYGISFKKNPPDDYVMQTTTVATEPQELSYESPSSQRSAHQQRPGKLQKPVEHSFFIPTFGTSAPLRPRSSIPDLVVEDVGDEPMEEEEEDVVVEPLPMPPLKIRLPTDKSVDGEEKNNVQEDDSLSTSEVSSASEAIVGDDADSEAVFDDEDDEDHIILEGEKTPLHLNDDDVFSEEPPKKLIYTGEQANDLVNAAYDRLLQHAHTPGDPLEGAVVTTAFIESDSDLNDEAPIKGKRVVLVGKDRSLVRRTSDDDDDSSGRVVELVSDEEEPTPRRPEDVSDKAVQTDEEDMKKARPSGGVKEGDDTRATGKNDDTTIGDGIHFDDEVLLAVERRANEYYFPPEDVETASSIAYPADYVSVEKKLETPVLSRAKIENEKLTREKRGTAEAVGAGIQLPPLSTPTRTPNEKEQAQREDIDLPPLQMKSSVDRSTEDEHSEHLGEGISLPSTVLKPSSTDSKKEAGNLTMHPSTDLRHKPTVSKQEDIGKGVYLDDEVLIAVERRTNEYYFPPVSKTTSTEAPPALIDTGVDAHLPPPPLLRE
ncbi:hypothetical protein PMAYCL1PPCAC_20346, partial [Pristionchus mayeri]